MRHARIVRGLRQTRSPNTLTKDLRIRILTSLFFVTVASVTACSTDSATSTSFQGADAEADTFEGFQVEDTVTVLDTSPGEGADVEPGTDTQTSGSDAADDVASTLPDVESDVALPEDVEVDVEPSSDTTTPDVWADDAVDAGSVLTDAVAADTSEGDAGEPNPTDVALDDTSGGMDNGADMDTAEPTPDVPQIFPSFSKTGCQKTVNLNTDGTVNPFISPARNGQFYVSWVQKGGNLMLTWESPTLCETVEGPFQVNAAEGTVYYWGGIAVVSDNQGNFYAVWESTQSGKDIAFAYSETGLTFSEPIELVSTSTNGQDPAIWVPKAGEVHAAWRGHNPVLPQYDTLHAKGTNMFTGGTFSTGLMVNEDDPQDDQVALVGDGKGKLYLAWQRFDGDLFASRSLDNGASWSAPVQVNDVNGIANVSKATFMTITPEGRVVIIWSDERKQKSGNENDVFADSSLDGLNWGVDVQVNDVDALSGGSGVGRRDEWPV